MAADGELPERLRDVLDLFDFLPERSERIQALIEIADRFREVPAEVASRPYDEAHKVPGCESEAYLWAVPRAKGGLKFHFAVENPQGISARAMAVVLDEALSGAPLEQVARVPRDLPLRLFGNELSMGKNLGLTGMVGMVQAEARRCLATAASPDTPAP